MLHDLTQALQEDHALYFDNEHALIPHKGWAAPYVNGFVGYCDDPDEVFLIISRNRQPINPEDERDLEIIGRKVGYTVKITDSSITFTIY